MTTTELLQRLLILAIVLVVLHVLAHGGPRASWRKITAWAEEETRKDDDDQEP